MQGVAGWELEFAGFHRRINFDAIHPYKTELAKTVPM
jgi:hypothetical protein